MVLIIFLKGIDGINNKIEPPKVLEGSAYEKSNQKRPPVDMASALKIFENSEFINRAFGNEVHSHLVEFYKNEVDLYERTVTKWEFQRYFDLI